MHRRVPTRDDQPVPRVLAFLSEDPERFKVDANFYRYVFNRPAILTDPLGEDPGKSLCCPDEVPKLGTALTKVCQATKSGACQGVLKKYGLGQCFAEKCGNQVKFVCIKKGHDCGGCGGPCNHVADTSKQIFLQPAAGSTLCGPLSTGREFTIFNSNQRNYYHYRGRDMMPSLGRFLSEDPIRFLAGVNSYTYVGNMPTFYTDPLGLAKFPPIPTVPPPYPGDPLTNCMAVLMKWAKKALLKETQGLNDKYVHCITGCEVARACRKELNQNAAWAKEMLDAKGLGTPDAKDAFATLDGGDCKGVSLSCACCCMKKGYKPQG